MKRRTHRQPADTEAFSRMLGTYGLKMTPQRLAVHRAMLKHIHADADTVYDSVRSEGTRIARSSVYNILTSLADTGIYSRRFSSNGKVVFDINAWRHLHLYDSVNHEFVDIDAPDLLEEVQAFLKGHRFRGYRIEDIDIQIVCRPTKKKLL
ncbi:MAG: transcriptional repressor [Bacteroidales bacterium]|nr:transcriptional repressor [Bacteroidales bacterium]